MRTDFTEFTSKGLVLGVLKSADYEQAEHRDRENDLVVFMTDGVTECRDGERFIEIDEVLDVIRQ